MIAASAWYLDPNVWLAILMVAAGLGFVIFVHEMGHFLAAKACGVKCEKFYVGFDIPMPKIGSFQLPSSLFKFQYGETEYGIGVLPLGGYVKMLGQDDDPRRAAEENERIKLKTGDAAASQAANDAPSPSATYELDPRSFPAKKVWQRMIIISAGVVVNLIFAVIFAAVAFRSGVPYQAAVVGGAVPGSPAWEAGVRPGDRILQTSRDGRRNEHLRFDWDLMQDVVMHGDSRPMDLLVRHADGQEEWFKIQPRTAKSAQRSHPAIGVASMGVTTLDERKPTVDHLPAGRAGLVGGDRVVAVDGKEVDGFPALMAELWRHIDQPVTLTVERTEGAATGAAAGADAKTDAKTDANAKANGATRRVDVTIAPNRRKSFGMVMKHGPIGGVRPGSPAARAGVLPGDEIVTLAGEPLGDPLTLNSRIVRWFGQEIELVVRRAKSGEKSDEKSGETVALKITPEAPVVTADTASAGSLYGVESLGVAFPVERVVAAVTPDSPAARQGLQPGDKALEIQWVLPPELQEKFGKRYKEPIPLDDDRQNWAFIEYLVQGVEPGVGVRLTVERDGKQKSVEMTAVEGEGFNQQRGLIFPSVSETHVAESWGEALSLGVRQTKEDALRVVGMLRKLVAGQVSPFDLGGPGTIAVVAGSEAMRGTSRLLMFLTMLSANLAVINFMPVPALDGGHMVFLLWEGIFRRPVNERIQMNLTMVGVCCLLGLMIFVFGLDIWRFVKIFG